MLPDYKPEDFREMLFPFHKTDDPLKDFPKLQSYSEFNLEIEDRDKVIKYVGFAYDKGSPVQKIENIIHRKVTAAMLAGFVDTKNEFVQGMMKCENVIVNLMIVRYCRMMRSRLYILMVAGNETLNDAFEQLLNYEKSNKKNLLENSEARLKLLSQVEDNARKMDELSVELLSGDNNKDLSDVLYTISDMSEEEYINLTPEDFSKTSWLEGHPKITSYAD